MDVAAPITPPRRVAVIASEIHGRGVVAVEAISAGDTVEICPVLRVPAEQVANLDATVLYEYYFAWGGDAGVALGYGSLYNHSSTPNAEYIKHFDAAIVEIRALTDIAVGDEVTFSYTGTQVVAAPVSDAGDAG